MPSRRSPLVVLVVGLTLLVLSACEKPAPSATVFSGSNSEHREAICWSFEPDRGVEKDDCSLDLERQPADEVAQALLDEIAVIPTTPGETVGISVDPSVAENGWVVSINGRSLTREPVTDKYFRFTMPPGPLLRGDAQLVITAFTENGAQVRGSWIFGLSEAG
ncbi:MAG: hypothetical protein LH630_00870 [Actinomycetia bacterium]|nr:hypothetical protein [Actinomycetes bacterium]